MDELLTITRVVCASDPRLSTLPHVIHQIDALLLDESKQWTLESASEHGFVRLLHRLLKHEWPGFNQKQRHKHLFFGVRNGVILGHSASVVQWWLKSYMPGQTEQTTTNVVDWALAHFNPDVLRWLFEEDLFPTTGIRCKSKKFTRWLYDHNRHLPVSISMACCLGSQDDVEFMKWCLAIEKEVDCSFTIEDPDTVSYVAAYYGHLGILRKLPRYNPTRSALQTALRGGHLKLAKWLVNKFPKYGFLDPHCCSFHRISYEHCFLSDWKNINVKIIDWVANHFPWKDKSLRLKCLETLMVLAAARGQLDELQFLIRTHERLSQYQYAVVLSTDCMNAAAANGHLSVVKWLHDRQKRCTESAMDRAAGNGHLEVVQWLHRNRSEGCTISAMDDAAKEGYLHIVQWLHENRSEGCSSQAMDHAAKNGHYDTVKWLHENRIEGCTHYAMDDAAKFGHLEIVQWLHENRSEGCTTKAMDQAAENGHLDVIRFLHQTRSEGCTNLAQEYAFFKEHCDVFKWLHDNRSERISAFTIDQLLDSDYFYITKCGIFEFAATHPEYISMPLAIDTLIDYGYFRSAESVLRDALAAGITLSGSKYVDESPDRLDNSRMAAET